MSEVIYTLNSTEVHAVEYCIVSTASNSWKSSNPHSGVYKTDTARTLDANGGNPTCNQGGVLIIEIRDSKDDT